MMIRNSRNVLTARTSQSHPLQIAAVTPGAAAGRIGITFCPGKTQVSALSGAWARDLDDDLDIIRNWGASAVVTLVEPHELKLLQAERMGEAVRERHMDWFHLPIRDGSVPDKSFEQTWTSVGRNLRSRLRHGFDILIHCKGGLGRAGTIAARLLVEQGMAPQDAIRDVRAVRPGAIETSAQERYVFAQTPMTEDVPQTAPEVIRTRGRGALLGLAIGDAVGTALEFTQRDSYPVLTDMVGGGPFKLPAGEWTDDTAMALALADSLEARDGVDEADLMRRFVAWRDEGAYSCNGRCFDIGNTVSAALAQWQRTGNPIAGSTDPMSAGNGSLMRLAPVALRYWDDRAALYDAAARQSRTTHAAPEAVDACIAYAAVIADAIAGRPLHEILHRDGKGLAGRITAVVGGSWRGKPRHQIRASGYVAHSLEAALWCIARTGSFAEAVLTAANLGEDADTTAAITGQLAGALYGEESIPAEWRRHLVWYDRIGMMADRLLLR
jgi:ADP-ribosyl-[dinitrogen reductase] hydrolase